MTLNEFNKILLHKILTIDKNEEEFSLNITKLTFENKIIFFL